MRRLELKGGDLVGIFILAQQSFCEGGVNEFRFVCHV
jgi:hypothetical protein